MTITIPPEALEKAAKAACEYYTSKEWSDVNQGSKNVWRSVARVACLAMIEAWPGETMFKYHGYSGPCPKPPLPRSPDAEFLAKMDRLVLDYPIEFSPKRGEMADWSRLLSLARKGAEADALRAEVERLSGEWANNPLTHQLMAHADTGWAKTKRLTGERDRQYDQNAEQIVCIAALEAEAERLRAALESVMIGGNHLAAIIGATHPQAGTHHEAALAFYGSGHQYDAWCCWNAIMQARAALEEK